MREFTKFAIRGIRCFRSFPCRSLTNLTLNKAEIQRPDWVPFVKAKYGEYSQQKPSIRNAFAEDAFANRLLTHYLPAEVVTEIKPDLNRFGERVVAEIDDIGQQCELQPPKLHFDDGWGNVAGRVWTCDAWKKQKAISAEEGIVAIAYERKYAEYSRLYQMLKLYLYTPSSGLYSCPLAMTDGAAKTIEALGLTDSIFKEAFERMTSRDANRFWTSGQWMTEKAGGSDVGEEENYLSDFIKVLAMGTETVAIQECQNAYRLYGYKWFSSAVDSDISLTLARIADPKGKVVQGTKGLTLFFLKTRDDEGSLNNINVIKLKDKLGTRQLPTAELLLDGTLAFKICEEGRGVASISHMLQVTRVYNSVSAVSAMRRILLYSRDYMHRRKVFGKYLYEIPLHVQTLSRMDLEARAALIFMFEVGKLLGKHDCNTATDEERVMLRLLNPIIKLYTAKQAMTVMSEGLESFGGLGYIEETGFPRGLRDAQVLPIWEGTTNVLSMDVLRVLMKTNGEALKIFESNVAKKLQKPLLNESTKNMSKSITESLKQLVQVVHQNPMIMTVAARDFSYSLAQCYIGSILLEFSCSAAATKLDEEVTLRWITSRDLFPFLTNNRLNAYSNDAISSDCSLVLENHPLHTGH